MATSTTLDGAKTATSSTPILTKAQDETNLSGTALALNHRTGVVTKLIATLERNTGDDTTASWAEDDGHWYNEAYTGIIIFKQSTRISIF